MNSGSPESGYQDQNLTTDQSHGFYGTHNWPLSSETPLQQAGNTLLLGGSSWHTFGNVARSDRLEDAADSFASDRPASPRTLVPRAPSPPPGGSIEASSGSSGTTDDLYGPERLFGPLVSAHHNDAFAEAAARLRNPANLSAGLRTSGNSALGAVFARGILPANVMGPVLAGATGLGGPSALGSLAAGSNPGGFFKDPLARDATNVTPGVDDAPYILYALDALTGHVTSSGQPPRDSSSSNDNHSSFPYQHIPDEGLGYYRPRFPHRSDVSIGTTALRRSLDAPAVQPPLRPSLADRFVSQPPPLPPFRLPDVAAASAEERSNASATSSLSTLVHSASHPPPRASLPTHQLKDSWVYLNLKHFSPQAQLVFPPPNFRPAILRTGSLALLILLCLLMVAGLIFCAVYSHTHSGLAKYHGGSYGGFYFLFRVLPQLLSVIVLLYTQSVATALCRIRPFSRMEGFAHPHPKDRYAAIFDDLYPRSFLWPPSFGDGASWRAWVPLFVMWTMNLTVPLQSALFSPVAVDGNPRWATVQGVAWALVGLYVCLTAALVYILAYWYNRPTGLIWDPRSIADFIVLATNSNTISDYRGSELLAGRNELRRALRRRTVDKLGYWAWRDNRSSDVWHGLGTDSLDDAWLDSQAASEKFGQEGRRRQPPLWKEKPRTPQSGTTPAAIDLEALALSPHAEHVRYRYLPWCMRTGSLLCFGLAAFLLLLALFVVSFLPSTSIESGFRPLVSAAPASGAFSAANFLYSFLPALLGQVLFLLFAGLELSLRILQPWAELAKNAGGAQPQASILADYASCLPLQSAWHAAHNRHWRVVALSLTSALCAFLPALAGGLFTAQTVSSGEVRMLPNMVLYGLVLALLVLYLACLVCMLPGRRDFRLPHAVTCIAEVLSFCANNDLVREQAFKNARTKKDLINQLGVQSRPTDRSRWIFATGASGEDRRLGIHRVRRYTELTNRPSGRRPPASARAARLTHA
ncbi:hypothetical protein SPI_04024 [Niveomyces insectorum RCEF 264]|uniref:Phosphoribosylaminoimidazole-succinocarboxamide synthase n=1 Tax=Niveomyces insectorum RCEF 264 TaxID=1081102 RepID=A0A167VD68_9HYPO|nr:hypothetical protein SPI_04024 [Niveomyces insectorum RCEF 264]